jgi:hypothetical protein
MWQSMSIHSEIEEEKFKQNNSRTEHTGGESAWERINHRKKSGKQAVAKTTTQASTT